MKVAESMGRAHALSRSEWSDGEGGDAEHSKSTMDLSLRESQDGQETTKETEYGNTDQQTEQRTIVADGKNEEDSHL